MATIYRKTDKGRVEIETRVHRLPPRLRTALIMVDGQRSDADLAKLVPQSDDALDALSEQGFIASIGPPVASEASAAAAAGAAGAPSSPASVGADFAVRRREAVRMLTDSVGPVAEALALQIERSKDERTMRPLLVLARESIRNVRGAAAADTFTARFLT